jgi:hypothetical protein
MTEFLCMRARVVGKFDGIQSYEEARMRLVYHLSRAETSIRH